jgi:hypothetical protein
MPAKRNKQVTLKTPSTRLVIASGDVLGGGCAGVFMNWSIG